MSEQPDLIVLGGDYVTWGDRRAIVGAGRRGARAAVGAARRLRHPRQPRRRSRHAGGARRRGVQVLKDARTRLTIRNEQLELVGIRFWTKRAADIAAARARRRAAR